jgi:hypothetical protein
MGVLCYFFEACIIYMSTTILLVIFTAHNNVSSIMWNIL